jgi:hypothetical protein
LALRNETEALAASVNPLLKLGCRAEARRRLDEALDHLRQLKQYPASQVEPGSPADHVLQAQAEYEARGGNSADPLYRLAGRSSAADGIQQRRLNVWRQWAIKLPGNGFVGRQLEATQKR